MADKYYTPTIEEFHIGFEYEELWSSGKLISGHPDNKENWHPTIMKEFDEQMTPGPHLDMSEYRVKYLDKEDIESLGFSGYIPPHEYDHTWFKDNYILKAWFNHEVPIIRIMFIPNTIFFHGIIKNKSELKLLLKQLGIEQ